MSVGINGSKVVIENELGEIVGQGSMTLTINGTPIDVSNKSHQDYVTLLGGELAGRQLVFSGEFVYNSDLQFRGVRLDAIYGNLGTYTITYTGSGATVDESFTGTFMPHGMSDALPHGESVKTNITFSSSGAFQHTQAADI